MHSQRQEALRRRRRRRQRKKERGNSSDFLLSDHIVIMDPVKDGSDGVKTAEHFYIDPRSRFKLVWDVASLLCVGHSVIVLPFALAFLRFEEEEGEPMYSVAIGYAVDAFFWLDIGVTFYSAYYSSRGTLVVDLKVIRERYAKSWLALDLLAVFPFEIFVRSRYSRNADLLKLTRLLRITRVLKFLESRYQSLHESARLYSRAVKILLFLVLSLHWIACAWHSLCSAGADEWCTSEYVHLRDNVSMQYASAYQVATSIILSNDPLQTYSASESVLSSRTLSILSFVMLVGGVLYIVALGNIAALITATVGRDELQRRKFEQVSDLSEHLKLPSALHSKMQSYFEYVWLRHQDVNEKRVEHFCATLPISLRNEVLLHAHREMLRNVPIFRFLNANCILEIVNRMTSVVALPGDLIVTKGKKNTGLYFISRGEVEVIVNNDDDEEEEEEEADADADDAKILLAAGDYFGEVSLLLDAPATATVQAISFCDLFYLSASDFQLIKRASPDIEQTLIDARKELFAKVLVRETGSSEDDEDAKKKKNETENEDSKGAPETTRTAKRSLHFCE
jgi:CRP-like cAMP-binding protein